LTSNGKPVQAKDIEEALHAAALDSVKQQLWPLVCRRLEGRPNMNASELFDELRAMYPG
jgi:hypothetical protein